MAKLIYSAITSLDGYVAEEDGNFDWSVPDEEVHTRTCLRTGIRHHLAGGRQDRVLHDAADGVQRQDPDRTRVRPRSGPADQGGIGTRHHRRRSRPCRPGIRAGLVDECHLFVTPLLVGVGKQLFPDHVRRKLELLDERRFGNGVVHLRYGTRA